MPSLIATYGGTAIVAPALREVPIESNTAALAFAEHASIAFDHAAKAEQITTLHVALDHARDIGAAVGIIMDRLHLSQADAFGRLRKVSQDRNRKLSQLAADNSPPAVVSCPA